VIRNHEYKMIKGIIFNNVFKSLSNDQIINIYETEKANGENG